jgi:molybdopterin-guanine dinucleotide biosynthesis protein A
MGIASCLAESSTEHNIVVACDIPDINATVLGVLLSWAEEYEIVVPSFRAGQQEPLFAVYRASVAGRAFEALDEGRRRVAALFERCSTKIVTIADAAWYANLNTRDDYAAYLSKTASGEGQGRHGDT